MAKHKEPVRIAEPDPNQITIPGVRPATLAERLQCRADMPMRDQLEMF